MSQHGCPVLCLDSNGMIISKCLGTALILNSTRAATDAHLVCEKCKFQTRFNHKIVSRWVKYSEIVGLFPNDKFFELKVCAMDIASDLAYS